MISLLDQAKAKAAIFHLNIKVFNTTHVSLKTLMVHHGVPQIGNIPNLNGDTVIVLLVSNFVKLNSINIEIL